MADDKEEEFMRERTLGEGAFGKVYLVSKSQDNGDKYAMKVMDLTKSKAEERELALQEAEVLRKFNHPHVLHYITSFEKDGLLCIVTEYCPNGDLAGYLEAQQDKGSLLEEKQILTWFFQTAQALKYLHGLNALHRDLKSPNIFLDDNYDVRLGDMGLTKVLEQPNAKAVTFCGSPYYMSPEIFSCKPYDSKSDIWSLGVIVYEMSTLNRPFDAMLMHQLVFKIVHGSLPNMPTGYCKGLVDLIAAMLSKDPDNRPTAIYFMFTHFHVSSHFFSSLVPCSLHFPGRYRILQSKRMAVDTLVLDEFLYERTLGEGAFGKVYLVSTSNDNGDKYAMKVMDLTTSKPEEREMALQEAIVLRKFNHPHVLHYITSFEDEGMLYIVTEYCPNGDLSEYLEAQQNKGSKLEEKQILTWFLQTAQALMYLHGLNALHRDLKSPNIFLDANYNVRLGDMGLTKILEKPNAKAVTFCGSPYYMSPEIFSCLPYDSKSDIWALGVIVFEMSTLERPFEAMLMHQLVFKIVHGSLPKMPVGYSKGLVDLITAMLSKDPKMRPTAAEIVNHAIFKDLKLTRPAPQKRPTKDGAKGADRKLWGSIIMGKSTLKASKYADDDALAAIAADKYKGAGSSKSKTVKNTNWNKTLTSSQVQMVFTDEDKERTLKANQQTEAQAMDVLALVIRTLTGIFPKGNPGSQPLEASRPKEKEAMLLRNIEQLQYYCVKVLDNDQAKFQKAYDILGAERQDSKLEESLIKLLGSEKWALIGVQLMYLKNFEYNIHKLQQQRKTAQQKTTKKGK